MTRRSWAAAAAGVALLLAVHALLVWPAHGLLLSDSTGYFADARWLVHKAGSTWQGPSSFYHPGWSLLVAPLYLALRVPRHVQLGALTINALLATAVLPASYALARRVVGLPPRLAAGAALVAATYPAVLLLAGYEWGEALWQLTFVLFVLAADACLRRSTPLTGLAVAVTGTALYAIHPRGLGIVAVTFVFLLLRRNGIGVAATVVLFLLTRLVNQLLLHAIYSPTSAGVEGDVLNRLLHLSLLWGAVKATFGQLWYLAVASFGLVPLGTLWLALSRRIDRRVARVTLSAVLATLAASALEMSNGYRVDHMVYGRYVESVAPVLLVCAAGALVAWRRHLFMLLTCGTVAVAGLAALVVLVRGGAKFTGDVMPLNVTGILVWRHSVSQVDVARVTIVTMLVTLVVLACARWRALPALLLTAALFTASAARVEARTLRPFDRFWEGVTRVADVARDAGGPVSYDMAAYDSEAADFYQWKLSDRRFRFFDSRREEPPSELVIASPTWSHAGAALIYAETGPVYRQALWALGAARDRLAGRGWVITTTASPTGRVDVKPPASIRGDAFVRVTVQHTGADGPWVPLQTLPGDKGITRVSAVWDDGTEQVSELDRVVLPGGSATSTLRLVAPGTKGRHTVSIGLKQEGGARWAARTFTVDVR